MKSGAKLALQYSLKGIIALLAFWFIYKQVIEKENVAGIISQFAEIGTTAHNKILIAVIFLLMFLNWSLEALKWKLMMRKLEEVPMLRSLKAIFSGLTISFFTPNRIGEYAGRIFHLREANRIKATLVTILENLSQLLITIVVGSVSLFFYLKEYAGLHEYLQTGITVLLLVFVGAILLIFFYVPVLDSSFLKTNFLKRFQKYFEVLAEYKRSELFTVLMLAALRYFIFTFQFYLLMKLFGIPSPYFQSMLLVNMIFFVLTLVPTFALTELGVRGAVAAYFLGKITYDSAAILNATVSLWFINLVIPAIIGIVFIFQFRFSKNTA